MLQLLIFLTLLLLPLSVPSQHTTFPKFGLLAGFLGVSCCSPPPIAAHFTCRSCCKHNLSWIFCRTAVVSNTSSCYCVRQKHPALFQSVFPPASFFGTNAHVTGPHLDSTSNLIASRSEGCACPAGCFLQERESQTVGAPVTKVMPSAPALLTLSLQNNHASK